MQMDNSIFSNFRGTLLVGFSGGADSSALLLLAAKGAAESGSEVIAVHFNHHLRGAESDQEAADAEKFARKLGVKFRKIDLDIAPGSNLESRARQARLEKWQELCATFTDPLVLLGHHLDDNIENFFIRIGRGSNSSGLKGMEFFSEVNGVRICRPLLIYTRDEIEEFLRENGVTSWAVDSSNFNCDFSRNVLRNRILPELYQIFPGGKKAVAATLNNIACDAAYLDGLAKTWYDDAEDRLSTQFWKNADRALTVRMLKMLCKELFNDDSPLSMAAVERFDDMILAGKNGVCVLDEKRHLRISGGEIFPDGAAPEPVSWMWRDQPDVRWGKWHFTVSMVDRLPEKMSLFQSCFRFAGFPEVLEIGVPCKGEAMLPFGRKKMVKIKDLRIKRKIPAFPVNPVLRIPGGNALWLPGIHHSGELLMRPDEPGVMISAEKIKDFD
ncbi:MAG: tRNA lysidine(34) synthetase TilS [Lentisphaerae bacterium]|nr:tRNA lysidine(34) synthetase TilS [Lentisphaerota bacterium]